MSTLHQILDALAARPDVEAVMVLSADGLPIHSTGRGKLDADAVAALAANFARGAARLGSAASCSDFSTSVLEYKDRLVVVRALGGEGHLFVLGAAAHNIGPLLHDLRQQGPSLAALL
jgi:predicted regulator of Ras-like GTPase activity (Roadblock/LC7/MglB family)